MNSETHKHGCHNRQPFIEIVTSITGYLPDWVKRPSWPNVMTKNCQYTKSDLGRADKSCAGCNWNES